MSRFAVGAMALLLALAPRAAPRAADAVDPETADTRPLSPAQLALFETPHLRNVAGPETLDYGYVQDSPAGFTDRIAVHVRQVNADGTKDLSFDYLTGAHQVWFPELDHFRGNPLLMLVLERDTQQMKEAVGLSAAYFRNKVRASFVDAASVSSTTFTLAGAATPATAITVHPFASDQRLERIPSLQAKSYTFVLADAVPGTLAEIRIDIPADAAMAVPAFSQRVTFTGVTP